LVTPAGKLRFPFHPLWISVSGASSPWFHISDPPNRTFFRLAFALGQFRTSPESDLPPELLLTSCQVASEPVTSKPLIDKPEQESVTDVGLGGIALAVGAGNKVAVAVGGEVGEGSRVLLASSTNSACGVK